MYAAVPRKAGRAIPRTLGVLAAGVSLLAAAGLCAGCARYQPRPGLTLTEGVLSAGIEMGYPPMEYYEADGKTPAGFDIQLTEALAGKMGLRARYIDTAWDGLLPGLRAGKYDIAVNVTITPERRGVYNFTKPYIDNAMAMAVRKDSSITIEKPGDIAGYRAAYQGDTTAGYFTARLRQQGTRFSAFSYDKITNCFDDLLLGRVDVVVVDSLAAQGFAEREDSPFVIAWQGPVDETIGICLKKGNDALTRAIDAALDELFADGTMLRISRDIFNRDVVSAVRE
ncbi:MAG: ABC transporter substrate-binding protein [Treponema sp.]|jgi:polar amino acid transport system substrate-binding protein|nr:ABC transporter substrate-binding protein [Treponema sp.]